MLDYTDESIAELEQALARGGARERGDQKAKTVSPRKRQPRS
jgi:hypothetical protein